MSWPLAILPGGVGMSRMIESDVTLLPEPLSPTIPSVSPRSRWNDTSLTALTMPSCVLNCVTRLRTSSNGGIGTPSRTYFVSRTRISWCVLRLRGCHTQYAIRHTLLGFTRVERIAQSITDKGKRQCDRPDRDRWRDHKPWLR